jgi:hypothetical protein
VQVSEFYSEIGRKLGDPSNTRWTTDVLLARMNRSATKILVYTNAVKTLETLTPTAGNEEVQLDTDVIDIIRVYILRTSGKWEKLGGYLRDQLDFEDPNWQNRDDGEPVAYTWDGTNQKIILVPAPNADNAIASGLRVYEVQKPADMVLTTDVPFSSNAAMIPYHMAIVHDVVADCFQDDATPEALQKAKFHRSGLMDRPGEFEIEIKKINSKFDTPEDIPVRLLWRPQGGRASKAGISSKSNPLGQ